MCMETQESTIGKAILRRKNGAGGIWLPELGWKDVLGGVSVMWPRRGLGGEHSLVSAGCSESLGRLRRAKNEDPEGFLMRQE